MQNGRHLLNIKPVITSMNAEIAFHKIQCPYKPLVSQAQNEVMRETTYKKSIAAITLNSKKLTFHKIRNKTRMLISLLSFNTVLYACVIARAIRQDKETKVIQTQREEVKLSLLNRQKPKGSSKKLLF